MRGNIQQTILCTVLLALAGQIVSSKLYYTTWSSQAGNINSTFASWDVTTGQQGMLFSQSSVVVLSAYNSKSNLFHLVGNGVNSVNLTTIDGQGNLISSVPTVTNLQCLKYSASQNALIGATMSTSGKITIVTVDYTTGRVSDRFSVPAAFGGDWIRSCDIDDTTGRLVLHQQTNMDAGSAEHLTMINYQSNAVVGQYRVVFNNTNNNYKFLANVAFSNSQLACIVGTSGNSTWFVQLGKFNFNSASGDITPALITPQPVEAFVVGFAYNPATSMFYTLSQGFPDDSARPWYLDTYDRSGARVRQMKLANQLILQPRDLIVVA